LKPSNDSAIHPEVDWPPKFKLDQKKKKKIAFKCVYSDVGKKKK
jgi:hypothetical protein